jgi:glyoxylase-like metal-dependent hydrolase (beta-lactamase superfamily II)
MNTLHAETLRVWLEEERPVTVLDIRPMAQREEWAIPGSLHIDAYEALKANDPAALVDVEVPNDRPVVTVCAAGKVSLVAALHLQARGIQALSLEGGMKAWSLAWNAATVPLSAGAVQVIQVRRTGKGCLSYLIGVDKEAFVIDAALDPQVYLNLAQRHGWQITSVFDTHIHADHLSRSRQLAEQSGATLVLPDQQRVSFPFMPIRDGDLFETRHLQLSALQTPGHTLESTCYLLEGQVLFTGDTLFPTGVGRPDLGADKHQARARASLLYDSLHKLFALPAHTLVLPGHTSRPVPFDSIPIAATLAEVKEQVKSISASHDLFVQTILSRIPPPPPNYKQIVQFNEIGQLPASNGIDLEAGGNRCAIS